LKVPPFTGARVVVYDDANPNRVISERRPKPGEVARLPDGDLHGFGVVQSHLDDLLERTEPGD
jgi:hypothetical protein